MVTGTAGGIGGALVEALAVAGARTVVATKLAIDGIAIDWLRASSEGGTP